MDLLGLRRVTAVPKVWDMVNFSTAAHIRGISERRATGPALV